MTFVTVAICTWNRAKLLDQTLAEMAKLRIPEGIDWELLVVNNNCTDDTDEVLAKHEENLPLRRLFEPKQGQSHSRNCAVDAAKGDLLIWTDDDVLVNENWLSAYVNAVNAWPRAGFFGGQILPWFECEPPQWLVAHRKLLEGVLVVRDLDSVERPLALSEFPFGANMAFRRSVFAKRRFDPKFGLIGDNDVRCDEIVYCRALHNDGVQGIWVPSATVSHFVPSDRMTPKYVWRHFQGSGRAQARIDPTNDGSQLFGAPRWLQRQYYERYAAYLCHRATGKSDWLPILCEAAVLRGRILEIRERTRLASNGSKLELSL